TKRVELVLSLERARGDAHRVEIERLREVPGEPVMERRARRGVPNLITVEFLVRPKARVEIAVDLFGRRNRNRAGQGGVEAALEAGERNARVGVEVRDLAERVDAGIGSPRPADADRRTGHRA